MITFMQQTDTFQSQKLRYMNAYELSGHCPSIVAVGIMVRRMTNKIQWEWLIKIKFTFIRSLSKFFIGSKNSQSPNKWHFHFYSCPVKCIVKTETKIMLHTLATKLWLHQCLNWYRQHRNELQFYGWIFFYFLCLKRLSWFCCYDLLDEIQVQKIILFPDRILFVFV